MGIIVVLYMTQELGDLVFDTKSHRGEVSDVIFLLRHDMAGVGVKFPRRFYPLKADCTMK